MECLAIWASGGRGSFEAYVFLREVLKHCENKPEIVVRGFWYLWALKRLGLRYRHETFGDRNAVEGFFSRFKERTKKFWNRFLFRSSFFLAELVKKLYGLTTTGGVNLTQPWLCITTEDNWNVIRKKNIWGVPERHKNTIARVKQDDKLLTYVKQENIGGEVKPSRIVAVYEVISELFKDSTRIFKTPRVWETNLSLGELRSSQLGYSISQLSLSS